MNTYIKVLIIVNGLLIPIVLGLLIYKYFTNKRFDSSFEEPQGIIVGEKLDKAKKDNVALQGIFYETPEHIYNSSNFYLPISVMTYEQAKDLKKASESAADIGYDYFNIIFLDKDYNVINQLVDKKAFIAEIYVHHDNNDTIDQTVQNIAYLISFTDSNGDGNLDSNDNHDLYISDLGGNNLTQVTKNKEIIDFNFINSNSEIFVRYKERRNIRDEYKRLKFGIYKIKDSTWFDLSKLDKKLNEIEKTLNK